MTSLMQRRSVLLGLAGSALLAGCWDDSSDHGPGTIVEVAQSDAQFSILVEAVTAAGLAGTLSGAGPFTVFAPTNAAFSALLTELGLTKSQLLANTDLLTAVLQYHVLNAKVAKSDVLLGQKISPLGGGIFKIDSVSGALKLTDGRNRVATVTATDLAASNGVIHVVDRVLLPANQTVVDTAQALAAGSPAEFTLLVEALGAAGLVDTLNGNGPWTVFAPTDAAFAALLTELRTTKDELFANTNLLTTVLTYHVVSGTVLKAEVPLNTAIPTVQGDSFKVGSDLAITDQNSRKASLVATDVLASNGVIHVIDKVILPNLAT